MVKSITRRERRDRAAAESSSLAWQIREFVRHHGQGEMTATAWLEVLKRQAPDAVRVAPEFPKGSAQFGRRLRELKAGLSLLKIEVSSTRSARGRIIRIESADHAEARLHFEATKPEREAIRKAREREEKQLLQAARASLKPRREPKRRKTS
jgi:hypothetical protein